MELASIEAPDAETDLAALSALVDAYRVFYDQPENLIGATAFVRERLASKDSRFFVVRVPNVVSAGLYSMLPRRTRVSGGFRG
jgi:hypothetical protein